MTSKIHNHFFLSLQKTIVGTAVGFKKYLRVKGVGYKILVTPNHNLEITVGYTHPVHGKLHPESQFKLTRKLRMMRVRALNLCTLMTSLYKVKNQKKPDPYRVKGIRLRKERISHKLVKKRRKKCLRLSFFYP
jgi:large subunit ribosomal protein L6